MFIFLQKKILSKVFRIFAGKCLRERVNLGYSEMGEDACLSRNSIRLIALSLRLPYSLVEFDFYLLTGTVNLI